ncbi:MAG: 5-formyltetrahydrofolate cyclo-ligase [Ilumatobacteraceae bacterium]
MVASDIDKPTLRRRMRMVRDLVDDRLMRSVELWSAVAATPEYAAAASVMAFVGCKGEPDTDPLFARLEADGKRLLLPRVHDGEIVVCAGDGPMTVSRFGVSEPTGPALPPGEVGFVLVPGLAFTADGCRLGYGGGFYDRFLPTCSAPNAGVCFSEQLVDALPTEAHDVRVQRVISA